MFECVGLVKGLWEYFLETVWRPRDPVKVRLSSREKIA